MTSPEQIMKRLFRLIKSKSLVHHRPDPLLAIQPQHLLKPVFRSIKDTLESHIALESKNIRVHLAARSIFFAGQIANTTDQTAEAHALEAFPKGLRTAAFEDDVGASAVGDSQNFLVPLRVGSVVDDVIRAHRLGSLEFLVRRRSHNR